MDVFKSYLDQIENQEHLQKTKEVLNWVIKTYPDLKPEIKWNQPMFTLNGTYIIGFSTSSKHIACAPEQSVVNRFSKEIKAAGYEHSKMLIKFPWEKPVEYRLLSKVIAYNIKEKEGYDTFWRT